MIPAAALVVLCGRSAVVEADVCEPFVVNGHIQVERSIGSPAIPADLKYETEVLWRPYGVHLEWIDSGAHGASPSGLSLDVFLERIIGPPGLAKGGTVLGMTSVGPSVRGARP